MAFLRCSFCKKYVKGLSVLYYSFENAKHFCCGYKGKLIGESNLNEKDFKILLKL